MLKLSLVLLAGLGLGLLVSGAVASDGTSTGVLGSYLSHRLEERYDISVGVTKSGTPFREDREIRYREVVVVPDHFGEFVNVTGDGTRAILWFRDSGGALRNVVLEGIHQRTFVVEKAGSILKEFNRRPL